MGLRLLQLRQMSGGDGHFGSPQAIRHLESTKTQCVWQEETSVDPQAKVIRRTGREASSLTRRRQRGSPEAITCGWAIFRSQSESFPYSGVPSPSFRILMGSPISFLRSLLPPVRLFPLSPYHTHEHHVHVILRCTVPPLTF